MNDIYHQDHNKRHYYFPVKGSRSVGIIESVCKPEKIDAEASSFILVNSFIGEYQKYLSPCEIDNNLTSWFDVIKYYENYFKIELGDFLHGDVHYWVQATIDRKLVGWATFQREESDCNAVYMNSLVVHPEYQNRGFGGQLVNALINLGEMPNLNAIHLLLRKKNHGGRIFYSKLGFLPDPKYQRKDKFVNFDLLEGFTWKNPALQNIDHLDLEYSPLETK